MSSRCISNISAPRTFQPRLFFISWNDTSFRDVFYDG